MGRVILLGIDGMDHGFVKEHLTQLPNLGKLAVEGVLAPLKSVFPADSIPAWITIFTGTGPDHHGIVESIDYLKKDYKSFAINTRAFQGKTFWDEASAAGKRVCVVNPFLAYPVWPVNGVMLSGPVFISGGNQAYPTELLESCPPPSLGGIVDFPTKKSLTSFVEKTTSDTRELASYTLELCGREEWDLFFVSFFTLDRLQHFLWRYCDPMDPTHPGANPHQDAILDLYRSFDAVVGDFYRRLGPEDTLMVISDHGHGMRCTRLLNLNEFLRKKGYLKAPGSLLSKKYWLEKGKNLALQALYRLRLEEYTKVIARVIPNPKKLKTAAHAISSGASRARLADFAGMGPYGGIRINEKAGQGEGYRQLVDEIIGELEALNREHGDKLFQWIARRGDRYNGKEIAVYPDIIFELHEGLGVNWGLYLPLISTNPFHRGISGGHKTFGVLGISNCSPVEKLDSCDLTDIYRLVMSMLSS